MHGISKMDLPEGESIELEICNSFAELNAPKAKFISLVNVGRGREVLKEVPESTEITIE